MFGRRFPRGWEGWTPPWMQPDWRGPRGPRAFGPPGPWGPRGWHQPSPEQQALRSTAVEVARLFAIASRSSVDHPERVAQLRDFLERSRKELSDIIYSSGSSTNPGNPPDIRPL
jgi:hypothetical protein